MSSPAHDTHAAAPEAPAPAPVAGLLVAALILLGFFALLYKVA
jgi:hypothetical protein